MSTLLTYKGYTAQVEFDPRDSVFVGRVLGVRDVVGFHGESVRELLADFHAAVDHYLAVCAKRKEKPEKPYSGKLLLRVEPEVHAAAARVAAMLGTSLNKWATAVLKREALEPAKTPALHVIAAQRAKAARAGKRR